MNNYRLLRLMVVAAVLAVNFGLFPLGDEGGGGIIFRLLRGLVAH